MRRRDFIKVIAASASTWPLDARSQEGKPPVIGYLNGSTLEASASLQAAFRQGVDEVGYIEGRNVTIEYRWAEGHLDRLASLAGPWWNVGGGSLPVFWVGVGRQPSRCFTPRARCIDNP